MIFFRKSRIGWVLALCVALSLQPFMTSCGKKVKTAKNYGKFMDAHDLKHLPRFNMPIEVNDRVIAWMEYFTGVGRRHFERYLRRSRRYLPMMYKVMKEENVPSDLVHIAMIESGYNPHAVSHAGAVGLWQFMKATGRRYGLNVTAWEDDRRDPYKATRAAARHFRDLYDEYGHWYLAMVGYNAGPGRIKKAIKISGSDDFWDMARHKRALRAETRDYVPKFIAATIMSRMPERFGFTNIEYEDPLEYDVSIVETQTDLDVIAKCAGSDYETIALLNSHLYRGATPDVKNYKIKIPKGKANRFNKMYAKLSKDERIKVVKYRVKKGDTLHRIARRYGVSTRVLASANNIGRKKGLRRGQVLTIPVGKAAQRRMLASRGRSGSKKRVYHRVRRGETAGQIARRYGVKVSQLRKWNGLNKRVTIRVGQKLKIYKRVRYASKSKDNKVSRGFEDLRHKIKSGETLGHVAEQYGVSSKNLMAWNDIKNPKRVRAGRTLVIRGKRRTSTSSNDTTAVNLATLDKQSRSGDTSKATSGKIVHVLKGGETLGHVAERYGVSSKQIMAWNKIKNPKRVRAGRKLKIYASKSTSTSTPTSTTVASTTPDRAVSKPKVTRAGSFTEYRVKPGETIGGIANRNGVTRKQLMAWNKIKNPKRIRVGQKLLIKRSSKGPSGSTSVAKRKVPISIPIKLADASKTQESVVAKVETKRSATSTKTAKNHKTYKVKSGDTLWGIARKHKVTIAQIQKWNNLTDPSKVKPGKSLKIMRN